MRIEATVMPLRQRIRSAPEHTKILSLAWNLPLEHACGKRRRGSTRVAKSSKASLSRRHRFRQLKQQQHSNLGRLTDPRQDVGRHLCGIVRLGGIWQRRNRWRRFVLLFPIINDKPYDRKQGQDDLPTERDCQYSWPRLDPREHKKLTTVPPSCTLTRKRLRCSGVISPRSCARTARLCSSDLSPGGM